jgi:DNA (cytosine-5)-methyltransferase 1
MAGGMGDDSLHWWFHGDDGTPDMSEPTDKPPYRVPSMEEVRAIPWNGLTVASLFAGCGGSSMGYRMAGFRVLWVNEFVEAARVCYAANKAEWTTLDGRDIRLVHPNEIIRDLMAKGLTELDILDGSPPCASFSTAGRRQAHWGQEKKYSDTVQRTDDLFHEYVRILRGLRPRVFVAENVSGLVKGVAKGYFLEILAALKESGYRVEARVLDAQWLGVPQQRQRVIFVGVRNDLDAAPAFPDPLPHRYSVRDAIPWIGRAVHDTSGQWSTGEITDRPAPSVTVGVNSVNANHFQIEDTGIERAHGFCGQGGHAPHGIDQPMMTVQAGRPVRVSQVRRYAKGEGRDVEVVDVTDQPSLTIRRSPNAVVEEVMIGANGGFGQEKWQTPDEPAKTIGIGSSSGNGRSAAGQVMVRKIGTNEEVAENVAASIDGYAIGEEYDRLHVGQPSEKYLNLVKADPEEPCPAVTASGATISLASVVHPTEKRKFTIAELKRICSFPDDFMVTGTYAQQWERLGRAVPPLMMRSIAEAIRDRILVPLRDRG